MQRIQKNPSRSSWVLPRAVPPTASPRMLAVSIGARLGQTMIVENRPGANGVLATDFVARSSTRWLYDLFHLDRARGQSFPVTRTPSTTPSRTSPQSDRYSSAPNVLVVPANSPFNSVKDLVTYAKANPGKLNFASSGGGASVHLSGELFKQQAGVDLVHIPYKGTGSLLPDLLTGVVDMAFPQLCRARCPHIQTGKLKAWASPPQSVRLLHRKSRPWRKLASPTTRMSTWYGLLGTREYAS